MSIFNSISVRSKMLLVVVLPFVVLAIMGFITLGGMKDIAMGGEHLYQDRIVPLQTLKGVSEAYSRQILLVASKATVDIITPAEARQEMEAAREQIQREWAQYEKLGHSAAEQKLVHNVAASIATADQAIERFSTVLASTGASALGEPLQRLYADVEPASTMVAELSQQELTLSTADYREMQAVHDTARKWFLIGTVIALLLLGAVNFMIYLAITLPIRALRDVFQVVAAKSDLSLRAPVLSSDGIGVAAEAFNTLISSFQKLVGKISQTSADLNGAAEELSKVSNTTGRAAIEQQAETEHVATAIQEMTTTVQDVARSAAEAASAARLADQQTQKGDRVVNSVISSIQKLAAQIQTAASVVEELESETMNIGSVLDVIRNIAEQTNLLALNAAIEAARAGEQGRGFAVVADEVRTLASRTQKSTQEIQQMIERLQAGAKNAVQAMEQGKNVADSTSGEAREAGRALAEALRAVATISDMNTQIASAAEEQTAVAEEISNNITNINGLSAKTAEGAEQVTRLGATLTHFARDLRTQAGSYRG